jgi:hypothetical protein
MRATVSDDPLAGVGAAEAHDVGVDVLDAGLDGLVGNLLGELRAGDALREARVVLDGRSVGGLAARHASLQHEQIEAETLAVKGGGRSGYPAADDDKIAVMKRHVLLDPPRAVSRARSPQPPTGRR